MSEQLRVRYFAKLAQKLLHTSQ